MVRYGKVQTYQMGVFSKKGLHTRRATCCDCRYCNIDGNSDACFTSGEEAGQGGGLSVQPAAVVLGYDSLHAGPR